MRPDSSCALAGSDGCELAGNRRSHALAAGGEEAQVGDLGPAIIIRRAFEIGRQAIAMDRTFSGLVAQGVALWLGVQAFINMGVCLGLLPTKGLTLPMMSYGGSGLVANMCAMALLMRVDYENRVLMRGGRT